MRFSLYAGGSTMVTSAVVLYAYATRLQFYPTVVYMVTSKPSLLVLSNMALMLTLLLGRITKRVFLGRLRDAEMDVVWENVRYTVTETCLALTVFREEMTAMVLVYFTALLFCKVFHWLCDARVEHVEQAQETSRLSHLRIVSLMVVLLMADLAFSATSIYNVMKTGPSVELLFGFEFIVLSLSNVTTFVRYCLSVADLHFVNGRWYNKSLYELYLKLIMDTVQLLVYMVFFALIFTYYGLPLHLVRQLYMSVRNVFERMRHFMRFRRVTNNLNERLGSATAEELEATDKVCIICREDMEVVEGRTHAGAPKRLPCGHIFHFFCLRNWLERQLTCPTCRAPISATGPAPVAAAAVAGAAGAAQARAARAQVGGGDAGAGGGAADAGAGAVGANANNNNNNAPSQQQAAVPNPGTGADTGASASASVQDTDTSSSTVGSGAGGATATATTASSVQDSTDGAGNGNSNGNGDGSDDSPEARRLHLQRQRMLHYGGQAPNDPSSVNPSTPNTAQSTTPLPTSYTAAVDGATSDTGATATATATAQLPQILAGGATASASTSTSSEATVPTTTTTSPATPAAAGAATTPAATTASHLPQVGQPFAGFPAMGFAPILPGAGGVGLPPFAPHGTSPSSDASTSGMGGLPGMFGGGGEAAGFPGTLPGLGELPLSATGLMTMNPLMLPTLAQDLERRIELMHMHLQLYHAQANAMQAYQDAMQVAADEATRFGQAEASASASTAAAAAQGGLNIDSLGAPPSGRPTAASPTVANGATANETPGVNSALQASESLSLSSLGGGDDAKGEVVDAVKQQEQRQPWNVVDAVDLSGGEGAGDEAEEEGHGEEVKVEVADEGLRRRRAAMAAAAEARLSSSSADNDNGGASTSDD